jgi:hypothetical protein
MRAMRDKKFEPLAANKKSPMAQFEGSKKLSS